MEAIREVIDAAEPRASARPSDRAPRLSRDSVLRRLLAAGDAAAVLLALLVALVIPDSPYDTAHRLPWGLVAIPLMVVLFKLYGLYDRDVKRISYSTVDDLPWLLHATVIGIPAAVVVLEVHAAAQVVLGRGAAVRRRRRRAGADGAVRGAPRRRPRARAVDRRRRDGSHARLEAGRSPRVPDRRRSAPLAPDGVGPNGAGSELGVLGTRAEPLTRSPCATA